MKRIRPYVVDDLPFPTTSEVVRAVIRARERGDMRRAGIYQAVIDRRVREKQRGVA